MNQVTQSLSVEPILSTALGLEVTVGRDEPHPLARALCQEVWSKSLLEREAWARQAGKGMDNILLYWDITSLKPILHGPFHQSVNVKQGSLPVSALMYHRSNVAFWQISGS